MAEYSFSPFSSFPLSYIAFQQAPRLSTSARLLCFTGKSLLDTISRLYLPCRGVRKGNRFALCLSAKAYHRKKPYRCCFRESLGRRLFSSMNVLRWWLLPGVAQDSPLLSDGPTFSAISVTRHSRGREAATKIIRNTGKSQRLWLRRSLRRMLFFQYVQLSAISVAHDEKNRTSKSFSMTACKTKK